MSVFFSVSSYVLNLRKTYDKDCTQMEIQFYNKDLDLGLGLIKSLPKKTWAWACTSPKGLVKT